MTAIKYNNDSNLIDRILEKTNNINNKNDEGYTALTYACLNNNLELCKKLIDCGAIVNKFDFKFINKQNKDIYNLLKDNTWFNLKKQAFIKYFNTFNKYSSIKTN